MTQGIDVKPAALSVPLTAKDGAPTTTSAQELKPLPFTLADIRKAIPPAAFEKNLAKSMFYLVFDYAMWGLTLYTMWVFTHSPQWGELSFPLKALATILYWNIVGFFMWCIFVVGHDCGHKTFSTYPLLNDVLGHVCHGSIAVPFYPWQLSHHYHHMYHNHVEKDFSYLWFPEDILAERPIAKAFHKAPVALAIFPFYGYFMYLLGMPDGCHYLPNLPGHRLWEIASSTESIKCLISTAAVIACLVGHFYALVGTWTNFAYYYGLPLLYFDWWLVTVTYLQHHHEESIVFDNHDWSFLIGGLETVDRTFGFGIDALHHHITDGHVVHHLFFLQIPHYNLPMATKALRAFLAPYEGYSIFTGEKTTVTAAEDLPLAQRLYKHEDTRDFIWRIHSYLVRLGFRTKRATPLPSKKTN